MTYICPFTRKDAEEIVPLDRAHFIDYSKRRNQIKCVSNERQENRTVEDLSRGGIIPDNRFENTPRSCPRCGNMAHLKSLVTFMHDRSHQFNRFGKKESHLCPYCCDTITDVYDGVAYNIVHHEENIYNRLPSDRRNYDDDAGDIISNRMANNFSVNYDLIRFKYAKRQYHLAVPKEQYLHQQNEDQGDRTKRSPRMTHILTNRLSFFPPYYRNNDVSRYSLQRHRRYIGKGYLAQERISSVLNMDADHNIKILYKGKVVYPCHCSSLSPQEISQTLIEITSLESSSSRDFSGKNFKTSLVVMGTRKEVIKEEKEIERNQEQEKKSSFTFIQVMEIIGLFGILFAVIIKGFIPFKDKYISSQP